MAVRERLGQELVQYRKAPLVLARLESAMGQPAFLALIQAFSTLRRKPPCLSGYGLSMPRKVRGFASVQTNTVGWV